MLLDDFTVGNYRYEIFDTGGRLIKWTRINTTDTSAPIEIRRYGPTHDGARLSRHSMTD